MRRRQRGSAMIEAALIFPVLITMVFGLVQFGQYLLAYNFVAYAAREATRYASVHGKDSAKPATAESIEQYVRNLAMGVDPARVRVTSAWTPDHAAGATLRVEVAVGDVKAASQVVVIH